MSIGILQLSDIHLKGNEPNVEGWADAIANAVQTKCASLTTLLVLVSGDVAFSGKANQYQIAQRFLERLFERLRGINGLTLIGPVIVPGNHDCDFDTEGDVRPELLGSLSKRIAGLNVVGQTVEQLTNVQSAFYEFERGYSEMERENSGRLYYDQSFDSPEGKIIVHCFNTAWVSRLKEVRGQLLFPDAIQPSNPESRPALVVSVFHHPYAWLESANAKKFQRRIESISDIVFTGHEHDGDSFSRESSGGERVEYIEGAALQASDAKTGFNFVIVDKESGRYEVVPYESEGKHFRTLEPREASFVRNPRLLGQYFENSPDFKRELTRLGGTFSHPVKDEPDVKDLFVYPDFRARSLLDKRDKLISSENLLEFVAAQKYLHVSGNVLSGKTTLAKKLYVDLQDYHEYVPVLVRGTDLKGSLKSAISASTERAFRDQYAAEHLDRFRELDRTKKAVIIDDWHLVKFNSKAKAELLDMAKKLFGVVITLGTDGTWLQECKAPL